MWVSVHLFASVNFCRERELVKLIPIFQVRLSIVLCSDKRNSHRLLGFKLLKKLFCVPIHASLQQLQMFSSIADLATGFPFSTVMS